MKNFIEVVVGDFRASYSNKEREITNIFNQIVASVDLLSELTDLIISLFRFDLGKFRYFFPALKKQTNKPENLLNLHRRFSVVVQLFDICRCQPSINLLVSFWIIHIQSAELTEF